ncbi:MAG: nuclear transport factor 2 family protein [Deltaproteobacteria bacterium]|jgi:ketosteroid isomerase-like protein
MILKRGLLLALLSCFALVSPCLAKQGDAKITAEVKSVIEQHNLALSAQNIKGIMSIYSSDPSTVLMGTGPGEAYVGEEGLSGAYNQIFNRFKADSLSFKYDWVATGSKGDIAWFAVTTTMSGIVNNEQKERAFNMSGLLRKDKGKWRIVSMHFSRLGAEE